MSSYHQSKLDADNLLAVLRDNLRWLPSTAIEAIDECSRLLGFDYFDLASPQEHCIHWSPNAPPASPTIGLLDWMEDHEVQSSPIWKFESSPDPILGNGLNATSNIEKNQLLMKIPRTMMLSAKLPPGRVAILAPLLDDLDDNPSLQLAVCLLYHFKQSLRSATDARSSKSRGDTSGAESSPFAAYIQSLPQRFGVPLFWSKDILRAAAGLPCAIKCIQNIRATIALFFRLKGSLKKFNIFNFKEESISWIEFRWAISIVSTRQNSIPCSPTQSCPTLVPIWDMMNHEWGDMTSQYNIETDSLEYFAMKSINIEAGGSSSNVSEDTSINMCYGHRSNEQLLIYSGFAVSDNRYDSMDLSIPLKLDAISKIRELLLSNCNDPARPGLGLVSGKSSGGSCTHISINISYAAALACSSSDSSPDSSPSSNQISANVLLKCLFVSLVGLLSRELAVNAMRCKDTILKLIHERTPDTASSSSSYEADNIRVSQFFSITDDLEPGLSTKVAESLSQRLKAEILKISSAVLISSTELQPSDFDRSVFREIEKLKASYINLLESLLIHLNNNIRTPAI